MSTDVDSALALLRTAVHDCGWTLDALAAHMHRDKSLVSRVLNGERPMTLSFLVALPNDVEALYESRRAEHFGLIVVAPLHGPDAVKAFVGGLLGVLTDRQKLAMAKADIPAAQQTRRPA